MVEPPRTPLRVDRLRALNLPLRVEVELDALGRPAVVRLRQDGIPAPRTSTPRHDVGGWSGAAEMPSPDECRRIEAVGEVWRVDDEWWRQPISRQYFDVVLEGGRHVVLYQDLATNQWWMQMP